MAVSLKGVVDIGSECLFDEFILIQKIRIGLRKSGFRFFHKGGSYNSWKFIIHKSAFE